MEVFKQIMWLIAGIGSFLIGMKFLSDNMEKIAGKSLKNFFNRSFKSKFVGVGLGAATTAVIQSSAVTTVMVVGFVNTGIMTLVQAATVIMGANIGTTITGQIVALESLPISPVCAALAGVGVFMVMFSKNNKVKDIGMALAGLGLVFVGLDLMKGSMSSFAESPFVTDALKTISNPFLLVLIGLVLTAVVQSSSATTAIIISMAGAGLSIGGGGDCVLFFILGTNIGTCVTALISSIGTNKNAKRACLIHLLFNIFGAVLFLVFLLLWENISGQSFMSMTFEKWFSDPQRQIAMFHTFFNVSCTLIFLPFTSLIVKLTEVIIRDKKQEEEKTQVCMYVDERFLSSPALAIGQIRLEVSRLASMAMDSYKMSYEGFKNDTMEFADKIYDNNKKISEVADVITEYLIKVSSLGLSIEYEREINSLHNNAADIVRISDLADNLIKYTRREVNENLVFSDIVHVQLEEMHSLIMKQYELISEIIRNKDVSAIAKSDEIENAIDAKRKELIAGHIERLNRGECNSENNSVYVNLVSNLERIGDHLNYMAHSVDTEN